MNLLTTTQNSDYALDHTANSVRLHEHFPGTDAPWHAESWFHYIFWGIHMWPEAWTAEYFG